MNRGPATWKYWRNDQGDITEQVDPNGKSTHYSYNRQGRLLEIRHPDGNRHQLGWNKSDYPSSKLELLATTHGRQMISSARLGDKHVCPLPGHGTTPIASASGDVNINCMGSARVGDACGCGAVITTGFPSIQVNGRPMAHLGSPTSHGGTIITGSGDVGGGFFMGDAGGATIINFMALGAFRPDGTVDDEKMATLLADPNLKEKALAANALVDPQASTEKAEAKTEPEAPTTCKDPDMMEQLADYIADEMNRNIKDPAVLEMKELNSFDPEAETKKFMELPLYLRLGQDPQFYNMALGKKAKAFAIWTKQVGQGQDWDHKPKWPNYLVHLGSNKGHMTSTTTSGRTSIMGMSA